MRGSGDVMAGQVRLSFFCLLLLVCVFARPDCVCRCVCGRKGKVGLDQNFGKRPPGKGWVGIVSLQGGPTSSAGRASRSDINTAVMYVLCGTTGVGHAHPVLFDLI